MKSLLGQALSTNNVKGNFTFLCREEAQKNKYKPEEEQVISPRSKSKSQKPAESPKHCPSVEKYKSARLRLTSRPGQFILLFCNWISINRKWGTLSISFIHSSLIFFLAHLSDLGLKWRIFGEALGFSSWFVLWRWIYLGKWFDLARVLFLGYFAETKSIIVLVELLLRKVLLGFSRVWVFLG